MERQFEQIVFRSHTPDDVQSHFGRRGPFTHRPQTGRYKTPVLLLNGICIFVTGALEALFRVLLSFASISAVETGSSVLEAGAMARKREGDGCGAAHVSDPEGLSSCPDWALAARVRL